MRLGAAAPIAIVFQNSHQYLILASHFSLTAAAATAVTVEVNARDVTVKGPRGSLSKSFKHSRVEIKVAKTAKGSIINVEMWFGNRKERARTRTISSHIANMIKGVTKGFEYKMRMVYAHFPINVNLEDNNRTVAIRNFLGEKKVMKVGLLDGTIVLR